MDAPDSNPLPWYTITKYSNNPYYNSIDIKRAVVFKSIFNNFSTTAN